jgi:hypothetical protein
MQTKGLIGPAAYDTMRVAGASVYVGSLVVMLCILVTERRLRGNAWLLGGLVFGMAFFLPTVLFRSVPLAFFPPAIAHGAQYILMMSVMSGRSSLGRLGLATMCGIGAVFGLAIDSMRAWPLILVATGIVQVHFLIDAKVWRLRERRQRAIMNQRFDFCLPA